MRATPSARWLPQDAADVQTLTQDVSTSCGESHSQQSGILESLEAGAEDASFEPILSADEAADLLRIHVKTFQAMARAGEVPCTRMGKYWRFRKSALDRWVSQQLESGHQSRRVS
jgi:excisionase family DNA binding protein